MKTIKESQPIHLNFPAFSLSYRQFNDAMMFHENLHRFDMDVWQLSNGQFQGKLIEANGNNVQIDRHFYNRLMKVEGTPQNQWAFGIPVHPLCLLFEQKYELEDNYIIMSPPQSAFKIVQKSTYELFVIYFSDEFLFNLCQQCHLPEPAELFKEANNHPCVMRCSPSQMLILRQSICQFFRHGILSLFSQRQESSLSPLIIRHFIDQLEGEIPEKLILTLAEAQNIEPKKITLKRTSVLNQAEDFMKTYAKADITTEDICRETGVSKRTLEYIFQDYYDISPKAYLKQIRLNKFREALKFQSSSRAKINEIAGEWGFLHSGHLAKDYYRLFGELPSETLKMRIS